MTDRMSTYAIRYAVLRPGHGLPEDFMPQDIIGSWFDIDSMPEHRGTITFMDPEEGISQAVTVATNRFERRGSEGATARVYEVRL